MIDLICGDCLEELKKMQNDTIDSIVTDPPYGLKFMGKKWDYDVPQVEVWKECLRVLKPGGHLLAFAGTRTQHRMAVNIEDAGFEIRDMIAWVYGSGFPKSQNISKAIDRTKGKTGQNIKAIKTILRQAHKKTGKTQKELNQICCFEASGYFRESSTWEAVLPPFDKWVILRNALNISNSMDSVFKEAEREIIGTDKSGKNAMLGGLQGVENGGEYNVTAPATEDAKQWDGWGSALKPALEPITVARKPLSEKTITANVLKWGTGGINIDASRVEGRERTEYGLKNSNRTLQNTYSTPSKAADFDATKGRWPANLIHDGSDEVVENFPHTKSGGGNKARKSPTGSNIFGVYGVQDDDLHYPNQGSSSRFFYCAKASKSERGEGNNHPTVKPLKLMQYLTKLVTPPGGTILDPFMGSGTTGIACINNDFDFVGIEIDTDYVEIARSRIESVKA